MMRFCVVSVALVALLSVERVLCGITIEIGSGKRRLALQKARAEKKKELRLREEDGDEEGASNPPESWPPFVTRGWLWKKGHVRHNWKRRYFELADDWSCLRYYSGADKDDRPLGEALGKLDLGGATATLGLDYVPRRAHVFSFTVRTKSEIYYFEAAAEEDRQRWIRTLNTAGRARLPMWPSDEEDEAPEKTFDDDDENGDDDENTAAAAKKTNSAKKNAPRYNDKDEKRRKEQMTAYAHFQSSDPSLQQRKTGLASALDRACVDAMIDDIVSYHKARAVARANLILNSEKTLAQINGALRGAYVVEAVELNLLDPVAGVRVLSAALAKTPKSVADRIEKKFRPPGDSENKACVHRLLVDFNWPQRLELRVRGVRPKGGGLPPVVRSFVPRNLLFKTHAISFSLASRLDGAAALALDLVSSRRAPWPKLRRVSIDRLPRVGLDDDALDVDDDRGVLGVVFSLVPREVIVGLLENAINDAVHRPGRPQLAWDVAEAHHNKEHGVSPNNRAEAAKTTTPIIGEDLVETTQHQKKRRQDFSLSDRWLHARPVSLSTVDALRSLAAIAAQAARAAARDSAYAASRVSAAAEGLRAAVLDGEAPIKRIDYDDDDLFYDDDDPLFEPSSSSSREEEEIITEESFDDDDASNFEGEKHLQKRDEDSGQASEDSCLTDEPAALKEETTQQNPPPEEETPEEAQVSSDAPAFENNKDDQDHHLQGDETKQDDEVTD